MRVLYVSLLVLAADQLTKIFVKGIQLPALGLSVKGMSLGQSIPVIRDLVQITFIENPNMAFGLEFGGKILLSLFALAACIGMTYYLYRIRHDSFAKRLAIALILAGAFGNLTDRIFYGVLYGYAPLFHGNVVDFVDFNLFTINWGNFHFKFWPIFNVADASVSVGVLSFLFLQRPRREEIAGAEPAGGEEAAVGNALPSGEPTATAQ
jgi:signal peptidase II